MKIILSKKQWEDVGIKAGWMKKASLSKEDIHENIAFYDPQRNLEGKLVTRKYHQTTVWMMLYSDGTIEELTNSDLARIEKL